MKELVLKQWQHLTCILMIIILNAGFFFPQFDGKKIQQGDIITSGQGYQALKEYSEETGKTYLWNPALFGGMPRLSAAPNKNNLIWKSYQWLRMGFAEPAGLFIAGTLLSYFMFVFLGVSPWLSLIFSIAAVMATGNLILWEAGHNSKIRTLIFTPLLIMGVLMVFEKKKYIPGLILLSFGLSMSFFARHPQMTYYIFIVLGVYGLVKLVETYKNGQWKNIAMGLGIGLLAVIIGLGTSASKTWSLYDYSKSTMRGNAILEKTDPTATVTSSSEVDGLDWQYAMQWSNDLRDLSATFIPGFVGGASNRKISRKSETYKAYNIRNAPMYWGQLPGTAGPLYLGSLVIFLFVFGLFYVKGGLKWWLGFGTLLMMALSMGINFEVFNKLIFEYFPLYNKFRAPQSVMNISSFFIPILSALAVQQIVSNKKILQTSKKKKINEPIRQDFKKSLLWATGICGGFALLVGLAGPAMFSFESPSDALLTQQGADLTPFIQDRKALMRGDAFRTLAFVLLCAGLMWLYMKKKIDSLVFISGLGLLMVIDIFGVGSRYLGHDKYVDERRVVLGREKASDQQILNVESNREDYRVLDLTISTFNSSGASYWHNTIGGMHPAKLQRYSDLIERHITQNNLGVLSMLNTKYIIVPDENNQPAVQQNSAAFGHAWYVDSIIKVNSANEEIDILGNMDTKTTAAVLDREFGDYIGDFDPQLELNSSIELTEYEPDRLTYSTRTNSEQLAVFSEIWYGPDKGWQAYIDGEPVDHIRANYVLRAMRVPAGEHEIVFEFKPKTYYMGEKISLASSLLLILLILGVLAPSARSWVTELRSSKDPA